MATRFGLQQSSGIQRCSVSWTSVSTCTLTRHKRKNSLLITASLASSDNGKPNLEEMQRRREQLRRKKEQVEKQLRRNMEQLRQQESRLAQARQSITVQSPEEQGNVFYMPGDSTSNTHQHNNVSNN